MKDHNNEISELYRYQFIDIDSKEDGEILIYRIYQDAKKEMYNPANFDGVNEEDLKNSMDHLFGFLEGGGVKAAYSLAVLNQMVDDTNLMYAISPLSSFDMDRAYLVQERFEYSQKVQNMFVKVGDCNSFLY